MTLDIGWIDWALLAVLVLSLIIGAFRGLVFELLAIAGWVAAYLIAGAVAPWLGLHLPVAAPGSSLNYGLAFALAFILVMIVWSVLSRLARGLVRATPLAPVDRLLGAVFGVARGAIVLLVVAAVVAMTPAGKSADWRASIGANLLIGTLQGLRDVLPPGWSKVLPA